MQIAVGRPTAIFGVCDMKRKTIILAVVAAAAMALILVGCGVKITNIAVPESAMVEKGESITLPVVYGTDDAPAVTPETAATGESAETDEKLAKAASKLTVEWTSSDESVATGPVISTPTDNGCPPEEHAVGWC